MANKKTRVASPAKSPKKGEKPAVYHIATQKLGSEIVSLPPVFSKDSKCLCIASGKTVEVYSTESSERIHALVKHQSQVIGLSIKHDGILSSCDTSGNVIEWCINKGELVKEFTINIPKVKVFFWYAHVGNMRSLVLTSSNIPEKTVLWLVDAGRYQKLMTGVLNLPHSIAFGCQRGNSLVVAALKEQGVAVKDLKSGIDKMHLTDERKFTCVTLHAEEQIMATGDVSGRILVWHDFIHQVRPPKAVYHWHTLPVSSLSFSSEGQYLYSGGSEKALVKWRLGTQTKQILPRMGATIKFVVNSPDNVCLATCHSDNAIRFIDSTKKITKAICGLVRHDPIRGLDGSKQSVLPCGLIWDPRFKSVVLNAQAGYLQWYDPEHDTMSFNMDIANRNVLTDERNQVIGNAEVLRSAVSSDGTWLATLEAWTNVTIGYRDLKLKFWRFNSTITNYELNTEVLVPHFGMVTSMEFQPGQLGRDNPCLVTLGEDKKFKIWRLIDDTDIYKQKDAWTCEAAGEFRGLMPKALSFSEDGSLLAIAFDSIITLWDPLNTNLNKTLSHILINEPIERLEFGRNQSFRYLVGATSNTLFSWDVITQSLHWKVGQLQSPINCLVPDPRSSYMAAVLKDTQVFIFNPNSPQPVHREKSITCSEPVAAIFVPRANQFTNGPDWLTSSRLLIVDDKQALMAVDDKSVIGTAHKLTTPISHMDSLPWTPFAAMRAQQQVSAAKQLKPIVHNTAGVQGYETVKSLLETPASALPPMSRLCTSFMKSLLISHDKSVGTNNEKTILIDAYPVDKTPQSKPAYQEEETLQKLLALDYSWLCA